MRMVAYPYSCPDIRDEDVEAVANLLRSGAFLSQGPEISAFEREISDETGCRHAIVCNSGTAALHLAYFALGAGPSKGLLTTPITFLATASAAVMCGAPVRFADVCRKTGNVTPVTIGIALDANIAADHVPLGIIAPVHLAGRPCDMPRIKELADAHGMAVVEDASHALGAVYQDEAGRPFKVGACAHSDFAVFSFHAIKHVCMGEGGVLCTNDDELASRVRRYMNHGIIRNSEEWVAPPEPDAPWYYEMQHIGWNYRATDLVCALGRSQLRRLDEGGVHRRHLADAYDDAFRSIEGISAPPSPVSDRGHAWHLYPVAIDFAKFGLTRGTVMRALAERGVGTQVHYIPLHHQPFYKDLPHTDLSGAEAYYASTLSIPMHMKVDEQAAQYIVNQLRSLLLRENQDPQSAD
jgi:dTDP-4-amino-4,6-dideoxygalactose transaminase